MDQREDVLHCMDGGAPEEGTFLGMQAMDLLTAALVLLVFVVLMWLYRRGSLNGVLPACFRRDTFVGAYGRSPAMKGCYVFGPDDPNRVWPLLNRCTYA